MPPQPLSKIRADAIVRLGPEALSRYPKLAAIVMRVIAEWADIDGTLAQILTFCLQADIAVGSAMFQALIGGEARAAALKAAAEKSLSPDDFKIFLAVLKANKPSRDRRHSFAHHIWGWAENLPDALLLMKPDLIVNYGVEWRQFIHDKKRPIELKDGVVRYVLRIPDQEMDLSQIQVFRKADLVRDLHAAQEANRLVHEIAMYVSSGARVGALKPLLASPQIAEILQRESL